MRDRLDQVQDAIRRIVVADFDLVDELNGYLLGMRGKLFRPTLLLLAEEVGDRRHPEAITLAAVVELVHLATLVHDDAVDHSVLRRGMPTLNALWSHQVAIIMGDYLYSRSVSELARLGDVGPIRVLAEAANAMTVGEMRQLTAHDALNFSEDEYEQWIACKTGSLISAACEIGASIGAPQYRADLARYGFQLGIAFQITDDLLDYTAPETITGKPSGLDLREHKVTLPLLGALREMDGPDRREVDALFADPEPGDEAIGRVIEIVDRWGGLDYARARAREYAGQAAAALDGLPEGTATRALRDAVEYAVGRNR